MPSQPVSFQPAETYEQALDAALRAFGVQPEFYDIWGDHHKVSPGVARAILTSIGVPSDSVQALNDALEQKLWNEWSTPLPATIVTSAAKPEVPISLETDPEFEITIRWEDGSTHSTRVNTATLPDHSTALLRGRRFVRKLLPLPDSRRLGYHQLAIQAGSATSETRLILCPDRAFLPHQTRCAGLAVSLYGLRSSRNWGCGDFTDLHSLSAWAANELGASFVALNPLHSIPNRQPYNTSPYLPNSTFYKNALYLDIERIPEFANYSVAQRIFESEAVQTEIASLREARYVEYERCWQLKFRFLKLLFRRFLHQVDPERTAAFREYVSREGALLDRYAVYCALDERIHRENPDIWIWPQWPPEYRDPGSDATQEFARTHQRSILLYKYIQWQVSEQLAEAQQQAQMAGMPIGLYHDLALATDRCGSDLWAYRDFYVDGCRVGSPPDGFSPKGQDWAFPPPNTVRHKQDGYRLFVESIRKNIQHGGALRIDHVMRFFRLYWIPDGFDATKGTYVHDSAEDLIRLLALESVRNEVMVVGEDLGTVEPHVRETLHRFGILSYRLLYFERNERGEFRLPQEYPQQSLVSISTHDLPTITGFWEGRDIEARRAAGLFPDDGSYHREWQRRREERQLMLDLFWKLGLLPSAFPKSAGELREFSGELHYAVMGFLALTPSAMMCVNQEDLTKDPDQQNLPGTTEQYPNWRHKMHFTLEELTTLPTARDYTAMVRGWLERTGRLVRQ